MRIISNVTINHHILLRSVGSIYKTGKIVAIALTAIGAITVLNKRSRAFIKSKAKLALSKLPTFNHLLHPNRKYAEFSKALKTKSGKDLRETVKKMTQTMSVKDCIELVYNSTYHSKFDDNDCLDDLSFSADDFDKTLKILRDETVSKKSLVNAAKDVRLSYDPLTAFRSKSPIEKRASIIDRIATRLSEFLYTITGKIFDIATLLQRIEEYPKTLFTLLFAFMVPLTFNRLWETLKPTLEKVFGSLISVETKNGGKITLILLAATALFYYLMRRENVHCITDLGAQLKYNGIPHKALHKLDCYRGVINKFKAILQTKRGRTGSNAFIVHEKDAEGSLTSIPETIAELAQTGEEEGIDASCNVWKINLDALTGACDTSHEVKIQWQNIVRDSRKKNAILDFGDFCWIIDALHSEGSATPIIETKETRLAKLILTSIERGQIRVIFNGDRETMHKMVHMPLYAKFFHVIEAPPIKPRKMREVLERVYNPKDRWKNLRLSEPSIDEIIKIGERYEEIRKDLPEDYFEHIDDVIRIIGSSRNQEPTMKSTLSPEKKKELRAQHTKNLQEFQKIAKGKGAKLDAFRKEKEKLVRLKWNLTQKGFSDDSPQLVKVSKDLLALEHFLIPSLYEEVQKELSALDGFPTEIGYDNLIDSLNKHFRRTLGPPSVREKARLKKLPEILKKKIQGRDKAIDDICKAIKKWRLNPAKNDEHGPALVLFLAGDPGTGKSKLAEILAKEMLKVHSIIENPISSPNTRSWDLPIHLRKGSFEKDMMMQINDHIQKNPTGFTVLEEVDKIGKQIKNKEDKEPTALDQLLKLVGDTKQEYTKKAEYSEFKDQVPPGETVDTRDHIFIFTSNHCSGQFTDNYEENKKILKKEIILQFEEPITQRITCMIPFEALTEHSIEEYIEKFTEDNVSNYKSYGAQITVDDSLRKYFIEKSKSEDLDKGIRPLGQFIKSTFTDLLQEHILSEKREREEIKPWNVTLKYDETEEKLVADLVADIDESEA